MAFGSLSSVQQILVKLQLLGGPKYRAELVESGAVTKEFAAANNLLGGAMAKTNKRSFLHNQLLFTMRRTMFYTTLAAAGLTAQIVRMGFAYDNAMQSANIALNQVIKPQRVLNAELQSLFLIAAKTPFQVKDITVAFRQMFISFRPFHVSMKTLNDTILAITNNLSATGKVTPAALQRVSIALSHMANIGHLTGQAVQQLAKDGLQLQPALRKELHLTEDQLQNLGKAGIPARDVLMALIKYSQSTPGIANAAFRQANLTLGGSWSSFKDYISQAAGGAIGGPSGTGGLFGTLQKDIMGVNKQLGIMSAHGKPVTLTEIATAIDRQLTPKTHLIINLFITFSTALKTLIGVFILMGKAIAFIFRPLDAVANLFGINHAAAKILGVTLGILTAIVIPLGAAYLALKTAIEIADFYLALNGRLIKGITKLQAIQTAVMESGGLIAAWRAYAFQQEAVFVEGKAGYTMMLKNNGVFAAFSRVLFTRVVPAVKATAIAFGELTLAEWGAIGIAAAISIGLVYAYWKWRDFRNIVNETAASLSGTIFPILGVYYALKKVYDILSLIHRLAQHPVRTATSGKGIGGFFSNIVNLAKNNVVPLGIGGRIPDVHFAGGGTMSTSGMALVGERGPEAVYLPGGSRVISNNQLSNVQPVEYSRGGGGNDRPIVVQVMLDRKVLAQGVARANQDYAARR